MLSKAYVIGIINEIPIVAVRPGKVPKVRPIKVLTRTIIIVKGFVSVDMTVETIRSKLNIDLSLII
jgi:hypothetical protein